MNKINCEIIEDMLPLYVEHLASKPTEEMVETHISTCENCQKKLQQLKSEIVIPMETEKEPLKGIQKKLKKKHTMIAILSGLIALVLATLVGVHLGSPILIDNYEDAVIVETDAEGNVSLIFSENVTGYKLEEISDEDTNGIYSLSCWNTKWNQLFSKEDERTISLADKEIAQIYYYSPETYETQQDILIYNNGTDALPAGVLTLPMHILNAYLFLAGILLLLGIFISVLLHKKDKKRISQKVTLLPAAYFVSSLLILTRKGDIYNAAYYFSGILILTIVLYALVFYVLNHTIWKKNNK